MKRTRRSSRGGEAPPVPSPISRESEAGALRRTTRVARQDRNSARSRKPPLSRSGAGSGRSAASKESAMTLDIAVDRSSPLWATLSDAEALAERAILASASACGVRLRESAEVGVQLVDDDAIRALNARWRGFDKPTNVLSFPAASHGKLAAAPMLGDIVVAYETTRREADDEGVSLADHFAHLIVHGFLHLVGFDHQDVGEAETMEALETRVLAGLAIADPYARCVPMGRE